MRDYVHTSNISDTTAICRPRVHQFICQQTAVRYQRMRYEWTLSKVLRTSDEPLMTRNKYMESLSEY
jgi:hypothetical protein